MFEKKTGAENVAIAMAELIIAIAHNEAEMGVTTGTAYSALEEVFYAFEGENVNTANEALEARKVMREAAYDQGWELDTEEFDLN